VHILVVNKEKEKTSFRSSFPYKEEEKVNAADQPLRLKNSCSDMSSS